MTRGHNSGDVLNTPAKDQLRSYVERIERIEDEELTPAKEAIKSVFAELKANGFDQKVLRKVLAEKKKDRAKRQEDAAVFDLYAHALGLDLF